LGLRVSLGFANGDDNSKPEPDRDGHLYTNGGTEIYTNT
jgi:hypothetical protein